MCITFSVIFLWDVEGVEKLVVVVDRQIDGPSSRLDHRFEILKHVDVGIGSQLLKYWIFDIFSDFKRNLKLH